jgi:hypothetical protein
MSRRRRGQASDPIGLVGWVFADLLLGLSVVFLATQPGDPKAKERAAVVSATTTTSTTTTTTTMPPGVDKNFACLRISTDPSIMTGPDSPQRDDYIATLAQKVRDNIASSVLKGREAGIVLSFGTAASTEEGTRIADAFNDDVLPRLPEVFGHSAARPFWGRNSGGASTGSVELNIYPLTGGAQASLPEAQRC